VKETTQPGQFPIPGPFDGNDYSVPVSYDHHEIQVKGYVDRVTLCHKDMVVGEHVRSWGKEGLFFGPALILSPFRWPSPY
jgi:hypothetical protein